MMEAIRERMAPVVIAVAIPLAAWMWVMRPALTARDEALREAAEVRLEREAWRERSSLTPEQIDERRERVRELIERGGERRSGLGEQEPLLDLADAHGVRVDRISPSRSPEVMAFGPAALRLAGYDVQAEGRYEAVARFLSALRARPMTGVERFNIDSDGDETVRLRCLVRLGAVESTASRVADVEVER